MIHTNHSVAKQGHVGQTRGFCGRYVTVHNRMWPIVTWSLGWLEVIGYNILCHK